MPNYSSGPLPQDDVVRFIDNFWYYWDGEKWQPIVAAPPYIKLWRIP